MKNLKLFMLSLMASSAVLANATSDAGFEPKKVAQCGTYSLYQYPYATFFSGIVHKEHRYEIVNEATQERMNSSFESHSEGAKLSATEIYQHDPTTGAAIKYRKLEINSWMGMFDLAITESSGGKTKANCTPVK